MDKHKTILQQFNKFASLVTANDVASLSKNKEEFTQLLNSKDMEALQHKALGGVTFMHLAAEHGNVKVMEFLTKECHMNVDVMDIRKGHPLLEAAANGKLNVMKWLKDQAADMLAADDRGDTALHIAAGCGHLDCVQFLVKQNSFNVDTKTALGVTALLYATAKGRVNVMKYLIESGADPFIMDTVRGWSAVHIAAGCNQADSLRWLINKFPLLFEQKTLAGDSVEAVARKEKCVDTYLACRAIAKAREKQDKLKEIMDVNKGKAIRTKEASKKAREETERLIKELELEPVSRIPPKKSSKKQKAKKQKSKGRVKSSQQRKGNSDDTETPEVDDDEQEQEEEKRERETKQDNDIKNEVGLEIQRKTILVENAVQGKWEVKISRKQRKRQQKKTVECNKLPQGHNDVDMRQSNNQQLQATEKIEKIETPNSELICNNKETEEKSAPKKLRPDALPWSPRRKRWVQSAKNGWKIDSSIITGRESDMNNLSAEVVESEFNRMLKKFVHMDTKARQAARRRFAKAAKLHEDNRLAEAEKMETSWRLSLKSRLATALIEKDVDQARNVLAEIDNAEQERTLHLNQESKGDRREEKDEVCDIVSEDEELQKLVEKSRQLINIPLNWKTKKLDNAQNKNSSTQSECEVVVNLDSSNNFRKNLEQSIQLWSELGVKKVQLHLRKDLSECIPIAVSKDFDFEIAQPGLIVLSKQL